MTKSTRGNWLKRFSRSLLTGAPRRLARQLPWSQRPGLEVLEERTLLSVTIAGTNNSGQGYAALDFAHSQGFVPPDTDGAAGPSSFVETVNQEIALYGNKSTGTPATLASLSTFWFTTGALPHADGGSRLSDPVITYNEQIGRFIVADQDINFSTHVSRFDVAVSRSSTPAALGTADWKFYSIVATEAGFDADYPGNFGYNHDATVFTLNMFGVSGGGHVQVISINNADLQNAVATPQIFQNDLADFSVRPTTMHGGATGDPMWLVTEHGDNTSIDVIKMTNVLSTTPSFLYTNIVVAPYSGTVAPKNPNGTSITTNIDARIQRAGESNNLLVAAHSVSISSTQDVIQWYEFNVGGATPTLQDQGRVSGGANTYLTYPAIDITTAGTIGLTYEKSGTDTPSDFLSVNVTGRTSADAAGTMQTPVVVPAGTGQANYTDFANPHRSGDLSGLNIDPVDGSFWAASEFANTEATANWGTAVANFTVSTPAATTHYSVTPSVSTTSAGTAFSVTVTALTAANATDPNYRGTVHFTSSDGSATLPANYTFTAGDNGVHTFTNITLVTAGNQSVTATDTSNGSITGSSSVTVTPAAASTFVVAGFPSPATAGVAGNFTVTAKDTFGNIATGYVGTVHFTSNDGQAVLPADSALTNGTGSFSATLKTAGTRSITATDTTTASITGSQSVTVNPAAASTLVVAGFPSAVTAGVAGSFSVTAKDSFGNTATGYTGTVHFSSSDGQATLPANSGLTSGTGTFSATLKTAGTQSLTATDTVTASITGSQTGITVNPAAASTLIVATYPTPVTAGSSNSFTVIAKDPFGNTATGYTGAVHFTSSDAQAVLPANSTLTNGTGSFNATLKTAGTQSLTATDTVTGSITGSQTGITVNAAAASTLIVSGFPNSVTAGVAGGFTVTAKDPFGNTASGYTGTVHFSSSDGQAALPADSTLTNGTGSFNATLKTAGTQSLTATDTVTASITGSQTGITVNAAAASTLVVAGYATPVTAGSSNSFTVTAKDPFGNTAAGYTGTVHFSSSDGQAALPANSTLTNGTGSFNATLKTAGTQSLSATDTVTASITGSQTGITVNPASATTLVVAGYPTPVTAGSSNSFTVTAKDPFGNLATGYTGTVHFSSSDGQAVLPADSTLTNGTGLFSATLKMAGTQSLTATDTVTGSITGSQTGILVNAAAASTLVVAGFPSSITAGNAGGFTVTAKDPFGNTATGYTGTVHFTSSDGQAALPADSTLTNGTGSFSATLKTAAPQSLSATDTATASITGSQTGITVNAAAASTLIVSGFPNSVTAGVAGIFTVTAKDPFGNTATGYTGVVHFTSSDGQAALPADSTLTNGTGSFSATLKSAGTQSLTATDTVTASITGSQTGITVNAAAASTLVVAGFPSPITAGNAGGFAVAAKDPFGNIATGYTGTVHFTSSDGQAVLPADSTLTNGTGTFSATLKTAGNQSLTATDTVTSSITGSQLVTVNAAAVNHLLVTAPANSTSGVAFNVIVTAQDSFNNTVPTYQGAIHFTSSDGDATLPANYTFTPGDNGVHTFTNGVTLLTAGSQTITATDTITSSITGTATVNVMAAAQATHFSVTAPITATAGAAFSVIITALDGGNNTVTAYLGTIHFTSSDTAAGAFVPANYTFTAGDNGVHTFTNGVTLVTAGNQSVNVADTSNVTIAGTATVAVSPAAASTLVVSGFPTPVTAGVAGGFTVTAKDPFGNTATGYTGTVHFSSSDAQAVLPANSTLTNGTASFTATLKTAGTQSLTATDTATASITGSQTNITVNPAAASTLIVAGFPASVTAGAAGSFSVTAKDPFGNTATGYTGAVHFTSSDAQAALPADSTLTNGTGSFSATLKTAGTQSLTATDTVTASITGSQSGITVNPAAASTLVVGGFPSPATAGVAGVFTVTAKDAFGNIATGYVGTVHFASSDGQAVLPANSTLSNGAGSFSATLKTAGTQSLTATDTVTASITGSQLGITVNPAAASTLVVAGFPTVVTAGVAGSFTVTAKDPFGNTATGYAGAVHFTSSDSQAVLPANSTLTNGSGSFSATLKTVGSQSISATDTATASITGSQTGITVNPAAASTLIVSSFPSPVTAGVAGSFAVTAKDPFGNIATGYSGTLHFTSSDAQAVLPANATLSNGTGSFSATLKTAGSQSLTATDTVTSSITGTQSGITVNAAAASTLIVGGFPSPVTAGVSSSFSVTAKDPFGNTATGYTGTVHFTSSDAQVVLPANSTLNNGTGSFNATLKTVGSQSLAATDTVTASITGSQTGITVNPAAASTFVVAGFPSPVTAGVAGSFTVTAKDTFGNIATSYGGTVHFTSSDAQAVLPADSTLTNGTKSFSATLKTAGTQSLTATDTATASITGSQTGITVNRATLSKLAVAGFPSPSTAGVAGSLTVTAQDAFGNTIPTYTGTVHFTSSDSKAVLPANYKFVSGDQGSHVFSATLKTAGAQSITASDSVTTTINGSQTAIQIVSAAVSQITLTGFPTPVAAGTVGAFTVTAKDAFSNIATVYRGTVHFTSTDAQAVLPANYTFASGDNGLHVFNATLKTTGSRTITATDTLTSSLTGTQTITVTPAAAQSLIVSGYVTSTTAGVSHTFVVTAKDPFGNTATGYVGTVHFTSSDGQAVLPANYTFLSGDAGKHTFSATLLTAGSRSITTTDTVTSSITGTQSGITVNPAATSTLLVSGFPSPVTVNTAGSFTVTSKDAFGNTTSAYRGTVNFTSSDGAAVLPGNYKFKAGDSGVHVFTATLKTAGTQSITATDTVTPSITGTDGGITVTTGAAATSLFSAHIDFTVAGDPIHVAGYAEDTGLAYGDRGNGLSYGWNQDNTANARNRDSALSPDERYDTFALMQKPNNPNASWKIAVPNGSYTIHIVAGDAKIVDGNFQINANGIRVVHSRPTSANHWVEGTASITVGDGFIIVTNSIYGQNNKIDYIDITQTSFEVPFLDGKVGDERPGKDILQLIHFRPGQDEEMDLSPLVASGASAAGTTNPTTSTQLTDQVFSTPIKNQVLSSATDGLVLALASKNSPSLADLLGEMV